jgi:hypothetical protein
LGKTTLSCLFGNIQVTSYILIPSTAKLLL